MTIKKQICAFLIFLLCIGLIGCGSDNDSLTTDTTPNDSVALAGEDVGRGFFDINVAVDSEAPEMSQGKLALYLDVIKQTFFGLEDQSVAADIIIAFRGSAVTLVTTSTTEQISGLITELSELGVKFEVCNVATTLFGVDNASILPEVKVVGNTFISAIGYQSKGYSPILIQ